MRTDNKTTNMNAYSLSIRKRKTQQQQQQQQQQQPYHHPIMPKSEVRGSASCSRSNLALISIIDLIYLDETAAITTGYY